MDRSPKTTVHTPRPKHHRNLDTPFPRRSNHDEQNPIDNDPKSVANPPANVAPKDEKPDKPSEVKRELTDEELEALAGGERNPCHAAF
jgi:hypothetical protein